MLRTAAWTTLTTAAALAATVMMPTATTTAAMTTRPPEREASGYCGQYRYNHCDFNYSSKHLINSLCDRYLLPVRQTAPALICT